MKKEKNYQEKEQERVLHGTSVLIVAIAVSMYFAGLFHFWGKEERAKSQIDKQVDSLKRTLPNYMEYETAIKHFRDSLTQQSNQRVYSD